MTPRVPNLSLDMDELMQMARRHRLVLCAALPTAPDEPSGGGGTGQTSEKTFTQAEVDAIATREKNQGKAAGVREVADQLGVTVDEAKALIQKSKDADEAQKTDAQKARAAADAEKATATQAKASADAERHATRVERALVRNGLAVPDAEGDDFIATAVGLVKTDVGADDATIKAAVEKLKGTVPALFGPPQASGGQQSDPGRGPGSGQVRSGDFGKGGDTEFERRFGQQKASA